MRITIKLPLAPLANPPPITLRFRHFEWCKTDRSLLSALHFRLVVRCAVIAASRQSRATFRYSAEAASQVARLNDRWRTQLLPFGS